MVYEAYNLTLIDSTGVQPLLQTVNEHLMFGWYGNLALLTLGVIILLSMLAYNNNLKKSLGLASVICGVISVAFRILSLVPDETVLITWVIAAVVVLLSLLIPD
jgi:hypothetical protein